MIPFVLAVALTWFAAPPLMSIPRGEKPHKIFDRPPAPPGHKETR